MPKFSVILAAAGQSSRFRDPNQKKPFVTLDQKPVWLYSAEKFLARNDVGQLIIVLAREDIPEFNSRFGANVAVLGLDVVAGGALRHQSVMNGLEKVNDDCDFVVIHDAARPCLPDDMIESVFSAAVECGAAIPAIPISSTVKRSADGRTVDETIDRSGLFEAQTPQVFNRSLLESAFARIGNSQPTDEAQLVENAGHKVSIVMGSPLNIKITTKQDLRFASACLKAMPGPRFDARPNPFANDQIWR